MKLHRSLLRGASLLALNTALVGALLPQQALATACSAVINATSTSCTWTGGNVSITNTGTITGAITGVLNPGNSVGTLTNSGSIGGTSFAILNGTTRGSVASTIAAITNSGSIGGDYGIYNGGSIGSIANSGGTIIGNYTGIANIGTIGVITNSGLISGSGYLGIYNGGTIGSITNNSGGTISGDYFGIVNNSASVGAVVNSGNIGGGNTGILNYGTIGSITNSGLISGGNYGIYNGGTIGSITNNSGGTISGGYTGIYNGGTIGSITNNSGGTISGDYYGIYSAGTIGTITNSGTIGGGNYGISNSGNIGGILSTGTITGALYNSGTISGNINVNQSLTITGGLGTLTGGTITTNNNDLVLDSGANQVLNDDVHVGASNSFSLAGTMQVNATHSVIGNYVQESGAELIIGITSPTSYGDLVVSGNATMTDAQISIGGTPTLGEAFTIVQDGGTATYTGVTATLVGRGLSAAVSSIASDGFDDLVVTASTNCQVVSSMDGAFGSAPCILWNGHNISIASNGVISGSNTGIINSGNSVGTLTNSGTITGSITGLYNSGSIAAITNSGSISGGSAGLYNDGGSIGALTNSGTISGNGSGIWNNDGTIGAITNSDLISGGSIGMWNEDGSISTVTNASGGVISGANYGIVNQGTIGSISNSGSIGGGWTGVYNDGGSIGAIANSGTISGGAFGVANAGSLGTITNSGTISGNALAGIYNTSGTIGTITNSDLISGGSGDTAGIWNNSGTIGAITNSDLINGGSIGMWNAGGGISTVTNASGGVISGGNYGIVNQGTIGSISNSGSIGGGWTGVYNDGGSIGAIANSGTISGNAEAGIWNNGGTIGTITNSDLISGGSGDTAGIWNNSGTIGAITNSDLINGGSIGMWNAGGGISTVTNAGGGVISGGNSGIVNQGTIGTITNSGIISGPMAIYSSGTILSAITNTGTISGNINVNQDLTITGGNSSTIGTLTGYGSVTGTITANNLTFDSNAYQLLNDDVIVGSGSGTVTNEGTLKIGAASAPTITGNYVGSGATLIFGVTDASEYGALTITGDATMTGSSVSLSSATIAGETFTIVQDEGTADYASITAFVRGFTTSVSSITGIGFDDLVVTASTNCQIVNGSDAAIGSASCVVWDNHNVTITNGGVVSGANTAIINTGNSVGTLTNSGSINGSITGLYNSGSVAAIVNTGTISGGTYGVFNDTGGSIGTVTIASGGVITGGSIGIENGTNRGSVASTIGVITNSGSIGGHFSGIFNAADGTISTIANNGGGVIIAADTAGISNYGTIGAITNSGSIGGGSEGIFNGGTIGTVTISGTISGDTAGIWNDHGTIGAITNSGSIGGGSEGIANSGTIGTITNSGLISGGRYGVWNYGSTIGTITNNGSIGGGTGIYNSGSIGGITNSSIGAINGGGVGVWNDGGSIGAVTNSGTISGGVSGIYNNGGSIGTITNSGVISGPWAIFSGYGGTILSAITNSGTIAGNINVSQDLTITGGNSSTIGTLTGYGSVTGTITANNLTFDGDAYQLLNDNVNVGGGSGTVTNEGTLKLTATHSITGNYLQDSGAVLAIGVASSISYGNLIVTGNATMEDAHISIGGTPLPGEHFTIVQDAGTANYAGITATVGGGYTGSVSSITATGFEDLIVSLYGNSGFGTIGTAGGGVAPGVGGALDQIQTIINNGGDASLAPILAALNAIGSISGSTAEGAAIKQLAPNQVAPPLIVTNAVATQTARVIEQHQLSLLEDSSDTGSIGRAAGSGYLAGSLWMQAMGGFANSETTANSDGYHQGFYGLTFGADQHLNADSMLGLALSWTQSHATGFDALAGSAITQNAYQATGYGTQRFGPTFVTAQAGLGYNFYDESRDISFLGSTARAAYGGMQYMGKIEGGWDFPITVGAAFPIGAMPVMSMHTLTVTPLAGFQVVAADNNGYTEHGSSADLTVGQQDIDSYQTSLGGQVKTTFATGWGSLMPEFKAAWVHDLSNTPISTQATLGGVGFTTETPRVAADGAQITVAATLQATDAISLRAEYDGDLRSAYQSQSGLVKFQWNF